MSKVLSPDTFFILEKKKKKKKLTDDALGDDERVAGALCDAATVDE